MSAFETCCTSSCDKIEGLAEQKRVVDAFDRLDRSFLEFTGPESVDEIERSLNALRRAIACLRET